MIIGTAGHVDHGKSALVEALTGRHMDPLPDERRRGITLDIHVVPLTLRDGAVAGIVDVPGHEDLVRTMIAGASGIDLVLLVVAANEGVMPQTREHLLVLEELGIPAGIPVVTKSDLAEPDWVELVRDELARSLAPSPISFAAPVVVSSRTGAGLGRLRDAIEDARKGIGGRSAQDLPRLPVDRVLSISGTGTVLTGTVASGSFRAGDAIRLLPSGLTGRLRSVQRHGGVVEVVQRGERAALAVSGVEPAQVHRGEVVTGATTAWEPTSMLDAVIRLSPDSPMALKQGTRVRLALGTAEVLGRLRLPAPITPGESGFTRITAETPLVARGGDRFVVRSYSPVRVIGGGTVLDSHPPSGRSALPGRIRWESVAERLSLVVSRSPAGLSPDEAAIRAGVAPDHIVKVAEEADLLVFPGLVVAPEVMMATEALAIQSVENHHHAHPRDEGIPLETLRSALRRSGKVAEAALGRLQASGMIRITNGLVAHRDFVPAGGATGGQMNRLVELVRAVGLAPGTVEELERETGIRDVAGILRRAEREGLVVAVERNRFVAKSALEQFAHGLSALSGRGPITPAGVRELTGLSRKHLIPLLEWADREGLTVRSGDARLPGPRLPAPGRA